MSYRISCFLWKERRDLVSVHEEVAEEWLQRGHEGEGGPGWGERIPQDGQGGGGGRKEGEQTKTRWGGGAQIQETSREKQLVSWIQRRRRSKDGEASGGEEEANKRRKVETERNRHCDVHCTHTWRFPCKESPEG